MPVSSCIGTSTDRPNHFTLPLLNQKSLRISRTESTVYMGQPHLNGKQSVFVILCKPSHLLCGVLDVIHSPDK